MSAVRIFIIDDHPLVAEAMEARFERLPDFEIAGCAASIGDALTRLPHANARVALLDLRIDGMRGSPTVEALAGHCHGVVLFTSRERDELVERLLRSGATAHVCKSADLAELDEAILRAARQPRPASELARRSADAAFPHETLSAREYDVYRLLIECQTPKQIAHDLGVARSTVYTHIDRVISKLGLQHPSEVVRYALEFDVSSA